VSNTANDAAVPVAPAAGLGRAMLSALIFPGTLACMLGTAIVAIQGLGWPAPVVVGLLSFATGVWVLIMERVHPHTPEWNRSRGDVPTDALHMVLSEVLPMQAFNAVAMGLLVGLSAWLSGYLGFGLWPAAWPLLAQLALALLVAEFPYYWWHRACHESPFLWRFHATHHSAERLYFLNAGRFHPVDTLVGYGLQASLLILLGCGPEMLALFGLFVAVHGLFQHANIAVRLGPLNRIFSMAEPHRWHHSRDIATANHNYGGNLIVWDLVFGTWFLPRDRRPDPADVGFHGMPNFPKTWWGQILSPFRWRRLKEEAARFGKDHA
jgi:sterol desaturase/sphingolipid hydroxylase (fatty acid hydroxylase superfamily)